MKILAALLLASILSLTGAGTKTDFDPNRFKLPEDAAVLVVVEGESKAATTCNVYVYEKTESGWTGILTTDGDMGRNGMNNYRIRNDGTTPIGVWQLNTPF